MCYVSAAQTGGDGLVGALAAKTQIKVFAEDGFSGSRGKLSVKVTRSMFALPTTAMRGCAVICAPCAKMNKGGLAIWVFNPV